MVTGTRAMRCLLIAACLPAGCSAPSATLDLITVARMGIKSATEAQTASHTELLQYYDMQAKSLDDAFDADVRLAESGQLKDADGNPLKLGAEWIISARKGYAAARDALADRKCGAEAAHAVNIDNLKASDEALDMASQLIVQQSSLTQTLKQHLINIQRRLIDGQ